MRKFSRNTDWANSETVGMQASGMSGAQAGFRSLMAERSARKYWASGARTGADMRRFHLLRRCVSCAEKPFLIWGRVYSTT